MPWCATLDRELEARVISVHAPDYAGGLEDGYLAAVRSLIALAADSHPETPRDPWRVTVLAGSHLSPGDVRELRDIAESFGLETVMVPDLSALDGSRVGLSALATGGVTLSPAARPAHELLTPSSSAPRSNQQRATCATGSRRPTP